MTSIAWDMGWEERAEARDAVHHRARAAHPDGRVLPLLVVNVSPGGLMARCEAACEPGDRLRVDLPPAGPVVAEVRWALGGRIGCRLERPLETAEYLAMLAALRR